VPSIDTATRVIHTLGLAPDLDYLARDGIAFRSDAAVAGAQVRVVDVHLAERTMDAKFLLHIDLLISEKINPIPIVLPLHPQYRGRWHYGFSIYLLMVEGYTSQVMIFLI